MKPVLALILIGLIVASLLLLALPAKAQEPLNLTIKPDGTVSPTTDLLERNGSKYTFRGDIFGTIWVQTNNIVIDGAGYTLEGNGINTGQNSEIGILLGGPDLSRRECRGVLVENLWIKNIPRGIYTVGGSNNSFIGNYLDASGVEIQGNANSTGDLIKHNTLINATISFDYNPNGTDVIVENNFFNSQIAVWLANPPILDRNFWSNYTAKYPDANELDSSGIWDNPYVSGEFEGGYNSTDYHPLVNPIMDFEVPNFTDLTLTQTAALSTPSPTPTSGAQTINPALLAAALIAFLVVIVAVAVIFRRNISSKRSNP